jgi:hypothetical protein
VETIKVARVEQRVGGLTAEDVGVTLNEGKELLGEVARLVLQTQMEEFATCARVCRDCTGRIERQALLPQRCPFADHPLPCKATVRQALRDQGWQRGRPVTVVSGGGLDAFAIMVNCSGCVTWRRKSCLS